MTPPSSHTVQDGLIASSLLTAPAWGAWLSQINSLLTTLSLSVGLIIGGYRLYRIWQRHQRQAGRHQKK